MYNFKVVGTAVQYVYISMLCNFTEVILSVETTTNSAPVLA